MCLKFIKILKLYLFHYAINIFKQIKSKREKIIKLFSKNICKISIKEYYFLIFLVITVWSDRFCFEKEIKCILKTLIYFVLKNIANEMLLIKSF